MFWNKPRAKNHPLRAKKGRNPLNPRLLYTILAHQSLKKGCGKVKCSIWWLMQDME